MADEPKRKFSLRAALGAAVATPGNMLKFQAGNIFGQVVNDLNPFNRLTGLQASPVARSFLQGYNSLNPRGTDPQTGGMSINITPIVQKLDELNNTVSKLLSTSDNRKPAVVAMGEKQIAIEKDQLKQEKTLVQLTEKSVVTTLNTIKDSIKTMSDCCMCPALDDIKEIQAVLVEETKKSVSLLHKIAFPDTAKLPDSRTFDDLNSAKMTAEINTDKTEYPRLAGATEEKKESIWDKLLSLFVGSFSPTGLIGKIGLGIASIASFNWLAKWWKAGTEFLTSIFNKVKSLFGFGGKAAVEGVEIVGEKVLPNAAKTGAKLIPALGNVGGKGLLMGAGKAVGRFMPIAGTVINGASAIDMVQQGKPLAASMYGAAAVGDATGLGAIPAAFLTVGGMIAEKFEPRTNMKRTMLEQMTGSNKQGNVNINNAPVNTTVVNNNQSSSAPVFIPAPARVLMDVSAEIHKHVG